MANILPVPESEKRVLENLIRDLTETYPDKVIKNLTRDHGKWSEKVTRLYKNIGYASRDDFFAAYGFSEEKTKGGRPSTDLTAIVEELVSRYEGDRFVISIDQLKEENPDLAPKFKTIQNKAKDLFGMTFNNYLKEKGVFKSDKAAYEDKNKEYKTKVDAMISELKSRYEGKELPKSVAELKDSNTDIENIANIGPWIERAYGEKSKDYLLGIGLLAKAEKKSNETKAPSLRGLPVEEKLRIITDDLLNRIHSADDKTETLTELTEKYPDIPSETTLRKWAKEACNQTGNEYFKSKGILLSHRELHSRKLEMMKHADDFAFDTDSDENEVFYQSISRFDVDNFLLDQSAGTVDAPVMPKGGTITIESSDGRIITVKNRLGSQMKKVLLDSVWPDSSHFFDLNIAKQYILDKEEVEQLMLSIEDTSDAWVYATPLVSADAPQIDFEEAKRRTAFLIGIAHLVGSEGWLKRIIDFAPKKKDGTFHKNRVVRLASTAFVETGRDLVYSNHEIGIIYAKTEDDNELVIHAEKRRISEEELALISRDFLSTNYKTLGLDKYISKTEDKTVKSVPKIINDGFRVEDNRLFINDSDEKDLFLAELAIFDSVTIDGDEIIIRYPHQENYYKKIGGDEVLINVEGMHEGIMDMWNSLLCFRGLYDYEHYCKRREKVHILELNGVRKYKGVELPKYKYGIGDPKYDCRINKTRKYSFKDSILRLAKYVEAFDREFDRWVDEEIVNDNKHYRGFTRCMRLHPEEPLKYALYTWSMPEESGRYVFPPSSGYSMYVEVLDDSMRLFLAE